MRVHPRVGGETRKPKAPERLTEGPSPRGRGNRHPVGSIVLCRHAGPSPRGRGNLDPPRSVRPARLPEGPSPRGRGNLLRIGVRTGVVGSIPAWAGKPPGTGRADWSLRVHPRVGGETRCVHSVQLRNAMRSIPAWAGKPVTPDSGIQRQDHEVHPRVGGETTWWHDGHDAGRLRSIPAWAGKPLRQSDPVSVRMSKIVDYYADSPAMRRIRFHTSRASGSAR